MSFHHAGSICWWFPYVIMLRKFQQIFGTKSNFHIFKTLFFLHSQHSINTVGYLLRCNIQNIKGCTLKRKLFQAKNKHFSSQRREASLLAAQVREREIFILLPVYKYALHSPPPSKGEPMTDRENLTSGKRTLQNNLKSNEFLKLP